MQKYQVNVTISSEADILNIYKYIAQDNKIAAEKWITEIERQIQSLEIFPLRCAVIPEAKELGEQYRHIIYGEYRTIFQVDGLIVTILRVIHSARLFDLAMFEL